MGCGFGRLGEGIDRSGLVRENELIYRYFVTGDKLIKDLQTWLLSLVLNIRKVARGDIHIVAYFFAALTPACPRCFYGLPESLEVIKWYWSFCHLYSPYYILRFTFLDISTQFFWVAKIIHNQRLVIIRLPVYSYTDRLLRKDGWSYGIYVLPGSREKMGDFWKASTKTLWGKPHTGCFKNRLYVADTERRRKAQRWAQKKQKKCCVVTFHGHLPAMLQKEAGIWNGF